MASLTSSPAVVFVTQSNASLAQRIAAILKAERHGLQQRITSRSADVLFTDTASHLRTLFRQQRPIIGICASGILIRCLAPCLSDKQQEPPVLSVTEDGAAIIPLLGGHKGANRLAQLLAEQLSAVAVITSASDSRFNVALDAPPGGWTLANPEHHKDFVAGLLAGAEARLNGCANWLKKSNLPFSAAARLTLTITEQAVSGSSEQLVYHPKTLAVGIGCERNTGADEIISLVKQTLSENKLAKQAVAGIFSIDLKMDEPALLALANEFDVPLRFFTAATLEQQTPRLAKPSDIVFREVGCHGVAEAAALAAAGPASELIIAKVKSQRATCAVARAPAIIDISSTGIARGSLAIIGIGPGDPQWCTPAAQQAVAAATDLVGYRLYLDLLGEATRDKTRHDYQLGEETSRARMALELAAAGKRVALVCSGDPGIYAMAALVFELLEKQQNPAWSRCEINIIPGISALQAAAARSGAPLGHDFCAISLSDLLTPWPVIEQRIRAAARGDFVIAFYNPVSRRRTIQLGRAVEILLTQRAADTPVIIARNLGRNQEQVKIISLAELTSDQVDMLTVVLIGSSETRRVGRWIYTPRGYAVKQQTLL